MTTAFEFPYIVSDSQLKTSALLNFAFGMAFLVVFISVRGSLRSVGGVYQRRRELADLFLQPPALLLGGLQQAWSWVTAVLCMSDADIVRTAGFDALLLNRTILLGLQIFSVLTALSVCILLPTYYSFDDVVTHRLHRGTNVAELSRTTISNLPPGHAILWLPTLAAYLVTGYCCWVLLVHCQSYAELRMAYMLCLDAAGAQPYQERRPRTTPRPAPDAGPSGRTGSAGKPGLGSGSLGLGSSLLPTSAAGSAASLQALHQSAASHGGYCVVQDHGNDSYGRHGVNGHVVVVDPAQPPHARLGDAAPAPAGTVSRLRTSHSAVSLAAIPAATTPGSEAAATLHSRMPKVASSGALTRMPCNPGSAFTPLAVEPGPGIPGTPLGSLGEGGLVAATHMGTGAPGGSSEPESRHAAAAAAVLRRLRARLRLVAPWLRHVVVGGAERAARHKAADNLVAWVSPLRMLAKDREDWAWQQLAMDRDTDPDLPPVPSGHPPPATAAHAGLLVASEAMLMALTGRAGDASGDTAGGGGRSTGGGGGGGGCGAGRLEWSESVAELAKSLGIRLARTGRSGRGGGCSAGGMGRVGHATAACGAPGVGLRPVNGAGPGGSRKALLAAGAEEEEGFVVVNLEDGESSSCGEGSDAEPEAPAVYRYWAPEAEQRCLARTLRRRQRRRATVEAVEAAAAREHGATPGQHSTLQSTRAVAAHSGGAGSSTGGIDGCFVGHADTAASAGVCGLGGNNGSLACQARSGGGSGVADGAGGADASAHGVPPPYADSDGEGDAERPWTGPQQQPLVVGRCNARLRQLLKVRHGGRGHLVNAHHYAVLVRDVVLRPVERFNAFGLPVLHSSSGEETGAHGRSSDPRVGHDAARSGERADVECGGAGGGVDASRGAEAGWERTGRCSGAGSSRGSSSPGDDRGNEAGSCGEDEYASLLTGTHEDGHGFQDSGGGGGEGLPGRPRRRPLLHPTSDLPLRDRALHRVRELRQQHPHPHPHPHLQQSGLQAAEHGAELRTNPKVAEAEAASCRPAALNVPAVPHEEDRGREPVWEQPDPLLGPFASPSGRRAGEVAVHAPAAAGAAATTSCEHASGRACIAPPLQTQPAASNGVVPGTHRDSDVAARTGLRGPCPSAAPDAAAALRDGCATCVGPAPTLPPCMQVPYDDSEEAAAVAAFYTQLFPDSFQRLVPVCNHRAVDELLFQWTAAMGQLAGALLAAHVAMRSAAPPTPSPTASPAGSHHTSPRHPNSTASTSSAPAASLLGKGATKPSLPTITTSSGPTGHPLPAPPDLPGPGSAHAAAIRRAAVAVSRLQERIAVERGRALHCPTRRAYVALFSSQRDAAAAAQCSPLAPPSRAQPLHFKACAAPPPDSVYWPALWTLPTSRAVRLLASAPLLLVLAFPIGALTGALANLPVAVCGGTPALNRLYWPWFCRHTDAHGHGQGVYSRLAKSLLTGVLPALLSLGWNAWVLPMALYLLSAIQSRCVSLPGMDRQMSRWFFWWSLLNMFLGAVVGGGVFQQLGAYLQDPGRLLLRIGTALPTASNFFMHYTLTKGLYSNWLRVLWPHLGSMAGATLRRVAGAALPRSWQDVFRIHSPPGYRFSSFYNGICQVLMVGLAYVVTAPLIAPIALLFFLTAYITWRYAIVYIYERQYESGGAMFPVVFEHMIGYLLVGELFSGAVLLTNGAWLQAALLWASLTPALLAFRRLCVRRYLQPLEHPPLSLAMAAPPAAVDAAVYLPPALREGAAGWYPESGKVWEQYGIPKYVI